MLDRLNELLASAEDVDADHATPELLGFDGRIVDLVGRTFYDAAGREVSLTRAEFQLLATFIRKPGRVLSRDQLRDAVVGRGSESYDRSIDMLVVRLRRKIELDPKVPRFILTVPGEGYKFAARPQRAEGPAISVAPDRDPPKLSISFYERRQMTVLACQISGFAVFAGKHDPEDHRAMPDRSSVCPRQSPAPADPRPNR